MFFLQLELDVSEQLLHWIQPRRVLGIEQDVHFQLPSCLEHLRVLVDDCIVHHHHNVCTLVLFLLAQAQQ